MKTKIVLRGGGDLASGIAIRLARTGNPPVITELPQPMAVRRLVSFCQAVYDGKVTIEEVTAVLCKDNTAVEAALSIGSIPVIVDPDGVFHRENKPDILIDCRMTKDPLDLKIDSAPFIIGVGPGFNVGVNCHAAIESKRGHYLGRVFWQGGTEPDSGEPESVGSHQSDRVLRAPADGMFITHVEIGEFVKADQIVAEVNGITIRSAFDGFLRGLLHTNVMVSKGLKVGDVDPRLDPVSCRLVSDKALSIGGGVLEAILSRKPYRELFCG